MKRSLLFKLVFCYLVCSLFLFVFLNTWGVSRIRHNLLEEKKTALYREGQLLSAEYLGSSFADRTGLDSLSAQLRVMDSFLNSRILIINKYGVIIVDTQSSETTRGAVNVLDQDPRFLDNSFNENTTLGGLFHEPMLTAAYSVTSGFEFRGYIILASSMADIRQASIHYNDIINICLLFFLAFLLLVFCYLYFQTVRPLKKIISAANEYTSGHFEYPLVIRSHDEYRDLCNAITYMVGEMSNLDDYRKKFVANISHDFRSPLTSIKGYAEAMLDGTIPPEIQDKYLNIILFETERLTKLTTNLLELNSFDNNGTLLDIATFDMNQTIKKTAAAFERICMEKKITLKLVFSDKETLVDADMGKIQQVLYNLLDNAIKFSHASSEIQISTQEKNDKVFISVKDHGVGIPKESLKKIWERFYKTDSSRGKDKKGTGLGLSITREIINAHGENIDVISTQGVGTEFIFTLPKAQ